MADIVIDTNILVIEAGLSHLEPRECHSGLLAFVLGNSELFLASDEHVLSEYNEKLYSKKNGLQSYWLSEMMSRGKVKNIKRVVLSRGVQTKLVEMHFDTGDTMFVRVAAASDSKHLVTEDDDYTRPIRKLLKDELSLKVTDAHGAWSCGCGR